MANDRFIEDLRRARDAAANKSRFTGRERLSLTYVRKEPDGWPLTRPATRHEWAHVLKLMIMRRVPKFGPIHKYKLLQYVHGDLNAASNAGKLYVEQDFTVMRKPEIVLGMMIGRDKTLRAAPSMEDDEMAYIAPAIYRTEYADEWIKLVPKTVEVVTNGLPTTSVLDLIVQALLDDE